MITRTIPESAVLRAVIDALLWRYRAVIIRVNSGAMQPDDNGGRYVPFNRWQVLGQDESASGISDVLALLPKIDQRYGEGTFIAVECKSPDRRRYGQPAQPSPEQAKFLEAVRERGGIGLVVDDVSQLEDELQKRGY